MAYGKSYESGWSNGKSCSSGIWMAYFMENPDVMWVKQYHKPPMTGNGNHTTYQNGDLGDGLLLFYPHYHI